MVDMFGVVVSAHGFFWRIHGHFLQILSSGSFRSAIGRVEQCEDFVVSLDFFKLHRIALRVLLVSRGVFLTGLDAFAIMDKEAQRFEANFAMQFVGWVSFSNLFARFHLWVIEFDGTHWLTIRCRFVLSWCRSTNSRGKAFSVWSAGIFSRSVDRCVIRPRETSLRWHWTGYKRKFRTWVRTRQPRALLARRRYVMFQWQALVWFVKLALRCLCFGLSCISRGWFFFGLWVSLQASIMGPKDSPIAGCVFSSWKYSVRQTFRSSRRIVISQWRFTTATWIRTARSAWIFWRSRIQKFRTWIRTCQPRALLARRRYVMFQWQALVRFVKPS